MAQSNEASTPPDTPPSKGAVETGRHAAEAPPWWRNLLDPKWIALFLALSVALPGMVFAFSRVGAATGVGEKAQGEVSIGEFQFVANANERSPIVAATFALHLALIPETETLARARLDSHKYRVQQAIEQLLRQAHGGDFEDPSLGDLRRQLQEQINETLGIRAVADCIVTDLDMIRTAREAPREPAGGLAGTLPWND